MARKRTAKRAAAEKRPGPRKAFKARTKGSARKGASSRKKRTRARSARGPLERVRVAGKKTWRALKSTTAHVVESVRDTFGTEERSSRR